jgi:hypothetical protein
MKRVQDIQNGIEADLETVESMIRDCLKQAEWLYKDKGKPYTELKLALAQRCVNTLNEFRKTRSSLLAKRQMFDSISLN